MGIGFDAKRLFCNFTGLGNYSRTLVKNLSEYYPEYDYHLYTPKAPLEEETRMFFNSKKFSIHSPSSALKKPLWRNWGVRKQFQSNGIKIFHGLSNEIPFGKMPHSTKTIVTIHDLIFKHYPETYPLWDRQVYDIKFKYACKNSDQIIAISESTKNDIVEHYKISEQKIKVIYQPVNPLFYHLKNKEQVEAVLKKYSIPQDYILSVGSIEARKNLKNVLRALSYIPETQRPILVIVGRGKQYKIECERLAQELKIQAHTIWINYLDNNQDLQALYQGAKALIYPSLFEGFGLPVLEALLSKTPVITSNLSSLPEAGGPDSIYVNPTDAEELSEAISRLLNDSDLQKEMIEKGYKYANEQFDAQNITRQIADTYKSVCL